MVQITLARTLIRNAEARAIVQLLEQEGGYRRPAWISFSCRDGQHTCHGERFAEDCVAELAACPHVAAIGVNCTAPSCVEQLLGAARVVLERLAAASPELAARAPALLCYPNTGEDWDAQARAWRSTPGALSGPAAYASAAQRWVEAGGAQLVGGCCRTNPTHIAAIRAALLPGAGGPAASEGEGARGAEGAAAGV